MRASGRLSARCPYCNSFVRLHDKVELWDMVTCGECNTPLQLVSLHPPELDYIDNEDLEYADYWEEEDWEGHEFNEN